MLAAVERILDAVERRNVSFLLWLGSFVSVVVVRTYLEALLGKTHSLPNATSMFLHFQLWNLNVLLGFTLVLAVLSKERIERVAKVTIFFFPLIILVPVLDSLITLGHGTTIRYISSTAELLSVAGSLFGLLYPTFLTPGQVVVVWVVLTLAACYVYVKRKSYLWAMATLGILYMLGLFYGSMPVLTSFIATGTDYPLAYVPVTYTIRVLALMALINAILYLYLHSKAKFVQMIVSVLKVPSAGMLSFAIAGVWLFRALELENPLNLQNGFFLLLGVALTGVFWNELRLVFVERCKHAFEHMPYSLAVVMFALMFGFLVSYEVAQCLLSIVATVFILELILNRKHDTMCRILCASLLTAFVYLLAFWAGFLSQLAALDLLRVEYSGIVVAASFFAILTLLLIEGKGQFKPMQGLWIRAVVSACSMMPFLLTYLVLQPEGILAATLLLSFASGLVTFVSPDERVLGAVYVVYLMVVLASI